MDLNYLRLNDQTKSEEYNDLLTQFREDNSDYFISYYQRMLVVLV